MNDFALWMCFFVFVFCRVNILDPLLRSLVYGTGCNIRFYKNDLPNDLFRNTRYKAHKLKFVCFILILSAYKPLIGG